MSFRAALDLAGGLALFLLAMAMMTEGLKAFAGEGLRRLLGRWTSTPTRGVLAGILITGIVQSSSAVTVAAIGFVNAGVLTLRQGLGVIFGTNLGTTMTGWLVSLVGFGLRIEAFALPLLAVGVALRLAAPGKRHQGLGEALAGFGLFFLGLAILKDAFAGLTAGYGLGVGGGLPTFLAAGFLATVLTQSSSAAIAIILTAAAGGVVGIEAAAAAVIGANLGTTSTAAFAVLGATPSAKRLALGHIAFNLVTGVVALVLLPVVLWLVERIADGLELEHSPAAVLALFHTTFNALGVAIMLPLAGRLARLLERSFRSAEEDLGRPQHLDATLATTPALAVGALRAELTRQRALVSELVYTAIAAPAEPSGAVERRAVATRTLGAAIAGFAGGVRAESMPREVADELARALRIARYLDEAARLAPRAEALRRAGETLADAGARVALGDALAAAAACVALAARADEPAAYDAERASALDRFQHEYEHAKTTLLAVAVERRLSVDAVGPLLDALSATRRLVEQLVQADRVLRTPARAAEIESEPDGAEGANAARRGQPAA